MVQLIKEYVKKNSFQQIVTSIRSLIKGCESLKRYAILMVYMYTCTCTCTLKRYMYAILMVYMYTCTYTKVRYTYSMHDVHMFVTKHVL